MLKYITKNLFLPVILSTIFANQSAFAQFKDLKVVGLGNSEDFIPSAARMPRKNALLKFSSVVPGLGNLRFTFNNEKEKPKNIFLTDKAGNKISNTKSFILVEGFVKIRHKEIPVHGTIINNSLKVVFNHASSRNLHNRTHRLLIPLDQNGAQLKASYRRHTIIKSFTAKCAEPLRMPVSKDSSHAGHGHQASRSGEISTSGIKTLDIGIHADAEWYGDFGEDAAAEISSIVSAADTIYQEQLGIGFNANYIEVLTDKSFGTRNNEDKVEYLSMLEQYNAYVQQQSYYNDSDAFHLFSSADVADGVLGLAYTGSMCLSKEYSVAYTSRYFLGSSFVENSEIITFAHEVGHNFDAVHTDSGIMTAYLSEPLPTEFSSTSITQIQSHVASYGSCLSDGDSGGGDTGGGNNEGTIGGGEEIQGIVLTGGIDDSGNALLQIDLPSGYENCDGKIRGGIRLDTLHHQRIIARFEPNAEQIILSGKFAKRAQSRNPGNGRQLRYYLLAQITCLDDGSAGSSLPLLIKPQRIKSPRRSQLQYDKWLKKFGKTLEQS